METISSPKMDIRDGPSNEYNTANLAIRDFTSLFPDGLGDPTDNVTVCDISKSETDFYAQKLKHLVRFGDYINDKWYCRFAAHPPFGY